MKSAIARLVAEQLVLVRDEVLRTAVQGLLVPPRCVDRYWDYGDDGQTFVCWMVLEHPASNTCIVYCAQGFGPEYPWGLLPLSGEHRSMGMDSQWYCSLEDAFRASSARNGEKPSGYEVQ